MTITEETRHTIYEAFRASFGDEVANGLMELLPPVGWADVATKHDLIALEERMDLRFDASDLRFQALEERMDLRFDASDLRFQALEERMDLRFDASEARFGERLERALRRQSTTFTASLLSGLALFGVIDRLVT